LNLGDDDDSDEGPGLPEYIEDRMSDDDLNAFNSDDDDFKIPEEGDFGTFKVSDEKLAEARGPIEPQPDEQLDANNVDLGQFGKDTSDVQNEYDPKEITILMKLMASEADAMNEYMDGAKETNVDVLRRLYADIANEERFHMEQLLYAKCEMTGEKYVPKDPDVKAEYEALLKMGMDEETAMQTAVDKCHIRGSITIEDDIDDVDEISKDMETMESTLMMFNALYDSTQMILESGNASPEDVNRAYDVFAEACVVQEAVYDATAASSEKSALSKANKHGPIQLLRDTIRFLIRAVMTMIRKFVEFIKRVSNRSREIRRFIKQNGLGAIFDEKASFYFINLKYPQAAYVDTHLDTLLGLAADTLQACASSLNVALNVQVHVQRDPKLNINNNMQRGAELLQGVQLVKSAFVIPKDENEYERIATALFGLSAEYDVDGKTYNTLNTLKLKCDAWSRFMQYTEGFLNQMDSLQQHTGSVYYTNRKKYDQAEKCLEAVVKTCKAWISAIQSDINTIIKLDQKAMIAATEEAEKYSQSINPHQKKMSENYEKNYRTPESSGQKVSKFNRFGR
jgi:rubrerythrin